MSRRVSSNRGRRLFKYSHRQFSIYRSDIRAYGYPHGNSLAVEGGEIVLSYHRSNKRRTVSRSRAIRESYGGHKKGIRDENVSRIEHARDDPSIDSDVTFNCTKIGLAHKVEGIEIGDR